MENRKLTQKLIDNLKPRKKQYDIRDTELFGFGVRVYPTERKVFFAQSQNRGRRKWEKLGDADEMSEPQARRLATVRISAIRQPGATRQFESMLFEDAGAMFFDRYRRNWKPATLHNSRAAYDAHILPFFQGMDIGMIERKHVERWFAALGNRPGVANRALPVLSVLMRETETYGLRSGNSNPCKGIRRYRREPRERFLSADELARLGAALESYRDTAPLAVSCLELLVLTGCRKGEITGLRWSSYRHGHLYLSDSKTGPKTVYLSTAARDVLDALPKTDARVFPSVRRKGEAGFRIVPHWLHIRSQSGLQGVRLHDLRHTYASVALAHGEHILTIGRLLGHADPETTLKYAHLANEQVQHTARAVSTAIAKVM